MVYLLFHVFSTNRTHTETKWFHQSAPCLSRVLKAFYPKWIQHLPLLLNTSVTRNILRNSQLPLLSLVYSLTLLYYYCGTFFYWENKRNLGGILHPIKSFTNRSVPLVRNEFRFRRHFRHRPFAFTTTSKNSHDINSIRRQFCNHTIVFRSSKHLHPPILWLQFHYILIRIIQTIPSTKLPF